MSKVKIEFDWAFEAALEPRKQELIHAFRPSVMQIIEELFKHCYRQLRASLAGGTQATTQGAYESFSKQGETIYVFVGLIVNRDLPTGAVVFVAPTLEKIKIMGEAWEKSCEQLLGARPVQ